LAVVALAFILLASIGASAQLGVPLNHSDPKLEPVTVRELVARYCRLDYSGARLVASDWPKLEPVVAWRTNPDFPLFMVTSRFDVDADLGFEHGKYQVVVHYRLLGKYDMTEGYSEEALNQIQNVLFTVAEVNGEWRITEAEPNYPHTSKAAAVQWLNQQMSATQDAMAKTIYQNALDVLQAQKASPLAK
jgi:hypothetical protein